MSDKSSVVKWLPEGSAVQYYQTVGCATTNKFWQRCPLRRGFWRLMMLFQGIAMMLESSPCRNKFTVLSQSDTSFMLVWSGWWQVSTERPGSSTKGRTPNTRYFVAKPSSSQITRFLKGFHRALNESHPAFIELSTEVILDPWSCFWKAPGETAFREPALSQYFLHCFYIVCPQIRSIHLFEHYLTNFTFIPSLDPIAQPVPATVKT